MTNAFLRPTYAGRRSSGRLRTAQQNRLTHDLPGLRLDSRVFGSRDEVIDSFAINRPTYTLWLEIGCGAGEHLIEVAKSLESSNSCMIGCEVFQNGIATIVRQLRQNDIDNVRLVDEPFEGLLLRLPHNCIDRVEALFPDPWPKKRHRKRRLYAEGRLNELNQRLVMGGVMRIASDIDSYIEDALEEAIDNGGWEIIADELNPPPERLIVTRYHAKARHAGRRIRMIELQKIAAPK